MVNTVCQWQLTGNSRAYLRRRFCSVNWGWKTHLKVGNTFLWAGELDWIRRRKWTEHIHLSASWLKMEFNELSHSLPPYLPCHDGLSPQAASQNQPFHVWSVLPWICHSNRKSHGYTPFYVLPLKPLKLQLKYCQKYKNLDWLLDSWNR